MACSVSFLVLLLEMTLNLSPPLVYHSSKTIMDMTMERPRSCYSNPAKTFSHSLNSLFISLALL